ncbi:hypothetical protein A5721_30280 [Mycobacterium vulneris]|nr:hypothetical protein A5721_30280 [Mycolicibacterium vulneris]
MEHEPTELAGAAEAETGSIYAWGLDYDDESPTRRLTPRRITALGVGASLVVVAVAAVVGLVALRQPDSTPTPSAAETVAPAPPLPSSSPVTVTIQAAPLPTYDPNPSDPAWKAEPRFSYGLATPHDERFSYDVIPGGRCGMATEEFGYSVGLGTIAFCDHNTWTWVLVTDGQYPFRGIHTRGSRCDGPGAAMSLEGRQMTCVISASGIGTWQGK